MKRTARLASALAGIVAGVALIADAKAVTVDIAAGPNGWGCTTCFGGPPSVYNPPFSSPGGPGLLVTLSIKESQVRFSSRFPPVHTPSQMRTRREISQLGTLIPV